MSKCCSARGKPCDVFSSNDPERPIPNRPDYPTLRERNRDIGKSLSTAFLSSSDMRDGISDIAQRRVWRGKRYARLPNISMLITANRSHEPGAHAGSLSRGNWLNCSRRSDSSCAARTRSYSKTFSASQQRSFQRKLLTEVFATVTRHVCRKNVDAKSETTK